MLTLGAFVGACVFSAGCEPGFKQSMEIAVDVVLFGAPALLLQLVTVLVAAGRLPRPPRITLGASVLLGLVAVGLGCAGLLSLSEAPAVARGKIAGEGLPHLAMVTSLNFWLMLVVVRIARTTPGVPTEGQADDPEIAASAGVPLRRPSALAELVLGALYPIAFVLAAWRIVRG
jgi:hypothetical protein